MATKRPVVVVTRTPYIGGCHRSADALVAHRVPFSDFDVELRVEHVGFEASSDVTFTAKRTQRVN